MDALLLDQMLLEYQERRQDALDHVPPPNERRSPSPISNSSSEATYEAEHGAGSTVPVADEVDFVHDAAIDHAEKATNLGPGSRNSSSSTSSLQDNSSRGSTSIYHPSATSPTINYERESPQQKLVAVFGRQFDMPDEVASCLQKLVSVEGLSRVPSIKFVPFTLKRKVLLKGSYDSDELSRHDLICMCYNASEARILLTGIDGFYTSLLRHTEAILGPNKVTFLITNYRQPSLANQDNLLIFPSLKARLQSQEALRVYLDNEHVFSWTDVPSIVHAERLIQLAELEKNPRNILSNQSCVCL